MRKFLLSCLIIIYSIIGVSQNVNISNGYIFDGEPYLAIDPANSSHMVVAWMGYLSLAPINIKTRVTFDGGQSWSTTNIISHANPQFGSADPSLGFDNSGTVFLSYVDYNTSIDSGGVYVVKSLYGGLSWSTPVEVIDAHSDLGKYPIDRPWMSVDCSSTATNGNIYINSMPPNVFGPLSPPFHPYLTISTDGGNSFQSWQYLDTAGWFSGDYIQQPMATNCISSSGVFYAVYPSYVPSQSVYAQYILASSNDGGNSFSYHTVFQSNHGVSDTLAKLGYLLRCDPSDANHLAFFYFDDTYGDIDVFMRESFNAGVSWSVPVRINDDMIGNNRMQDLVWADFDSDGDLVVAWRDRRNGTDSTYTTASEIYAAFRNKDSTNFSPNFTLTDSIISYDTILAYSGNDFMCVKMANDTLNAVWGDPRTGKLNIFFQKIDLATLAKSDAVLIAEESVRIYPNPVENKLNLPENLLINSVKIITISGSVIAKYQILPDQNSIDVSGLKQGIYFLEIESEKAMKVIKFVKR